MLALTNDAVEAVRNLLPGELKQTGGLRLSAERGDGGVNLRLGVVALPAEDDQVVEEHGARVFLDDEVAELLDDKVLDASIEENRVEFTIADQLEDADELED